MWDSQWPPPNLGTPSYHIHSGLIHQGESPPTVPAALSGCLWPVKRSVIKTKQKVYVCCWIHLASGLFFIFGKVKLLAVADSLNRCSCLREQRNEGRWRWMIFTSTHAEYYSVPHSFVATKKLICSAIYFSLQLLPLIEKMLDFWRQQCCISSSTVSYLQSD